MQRYFFDFHDGNVLRRDPEGIECNGPEVVRHEAMLALPQIAKDAIPQASRDTQVFTVSVRDESNATVYTATMTYTGLWLGNVPIPEPEKDSFS